MVVDSLVVVLDEPVSRIQVAQFESLLPCTDSFPEVGSLFVAELEVEQSTTESAEQVGSAGAPVVDEPVSHSNPRLESFTTAPHSPPAKLFRLLWNSFVNKLAPLECLSLTILCPP